MSRWAVAASLLLVACGEGESDGLLLPEVVEVGWEPAYNGRSDALGALVPVDVMVYDPTTGEPRGAVEVHVWTDDDAARPVAVEAVTRAQSEDRDTESTEFAPQLDVWDAEHDEFVSLVPSDDLVLLTDADGVARLYVFVDAFPPSPDLPGSFDPIRVMVGADETDDLFWLMPR
ncbi:MAG: hypothetical protein ABMA64_21655 [Myxococcota bacterium]